jgi:DNA-binding transcriptional LysR family regulator
MRLQQVDLNLLIILDALLREQNVTRAAERLHMSQPATSNALARLRRIMGDDLLVKSGRHLQLTPRAESLIGPVREVLGTIEQSILRPPTFDPQQDQRSFAITGSDYVGVTLIRPLLIWLAGHGPGLRIDMAPVSDRYLDALRRDEIDIAILPDRLADPQELPDCSCAPVITDRFVGAVWTRHPQAGDRLTAEMLAANPYLRYALPAAQGLVEDDLDAAGIARRVVATASNFAAMPFMLAGTSLVTLLPERLGRRVAQAADIVLLEPDFPLSPLTQSAFWHARHNHDPGHIWLRQQIFAVAESEHVTGTGTTGEPAALSTSRIPVIDDF